MKTSDVIRQDKRLTGERAGWDSWWQDLTDHFLPSRTYRHPKGQPQGSQFDRIYDTVGIESAEGLANMLTSRLSPAGEKWISYGPPPEFKDDEEITAYYRTCSEIVLDYVLHSNFYTERHEANLDKAALGTCNLFVSRGRRSLYQFKHVDLGTFNFTEDDEGTPLEIWRTLELTAAQAAEKFPTLGPKVSAALADPSAKHVQKFEFLHYVGPNPDANPEKLEAKYKKLVSRWVCKTDQIDLDLSGFDSFPYEISRMLKWSASDQWGLAPGRKAMPALHQVNWLEHLNDLAAELQVRPRTLTIADQVGQVDLRAGGRTVVSERAAQTNLPREWLTNARYDIGKDRAEEKREAVRRMFHQPLWQFLAQIDRQMTAYETSAREREQMHLFAPQLSRHESDSQPLHARLFGIALAAGKLPPPPAKLLRATGPDIPAPVARSESRLSKITRDVATQDFSAFIEILGQTAQLNPEVLDSFDLAAATREMARERNLPESIHRDEREVIEIARQRAAAQQAQEGLAGAEQAASAAAKASQADPNKLAEMAGMIQ